MIQKLLMTFLRGFSWTLGRLAAQRVVRGPRSPRRTPAPAPPPGALCDDDSHAGDWTCARCRGEAPDGNCQCLAGLYCTRCRTWVKPVQEPRA